MLQQTIWHIGKYQDNNNHIPICAKGQILQTFIFTFLLGIYNLKPVAVFTNSMKKCMDIENVSSIYRVYAFFTRKMSVNQLKRSRCWRCHASINLFFLRKILIVLFVTKQYLPFCVRTGCDALMKIPCSGFLPSFEVGLCYLRKWRRGESLRLF